MNKVRNLVILVNDYPTGFGEPFLEDELRILENDFNKIYIVQTAEKIGNHLGDPLYTPKNAKIEYLYEHPVKVSFLEKFAQASTFKFIYEFILAVWKHGLRPNIGLFKLNYYYWMHSYKGMKALKQFIKAEHIGLNETMFYSYWCDLNAIILARLKKKLSLEYIVRLHGWDLYFERHKIPFLPFREFIFKNAYKVLPVSNDGRKYVLQKKLNLQSDKVITSRLGVSTYSTNILYRQEEPSMSDTLTLKILTVSHINYVKRLDRLIDALASIKDIHIHWDHIGYGYEPYESELTGYAQKQLAECKNISFCFHGKYAKVEVRKFIEDSPVDVFVNCSEMEGIPVSIMEAMAAGIPVIAYGVGGIPGIVHNNSNGFLLIGDGDNEVSILKAAIGKFYQLSRPERLAMSTVAKKTWEKAFNSEKNYEFISKLLQKGDVDAPLIECNQCLIDSAVYPNIVLDKYGHCDICEIIEKKHAQILEQQKTGYLEKILSDIKSTKRGKNKYDCILGISGGVDSAYLALKAKEWGLNPLLVHIDNGWNSETAVHNIQALIKKLGFELYTVVIDWNEIKDLVRSFLKASVVDIDWANEMCSQASLYKVAKKFGVKHILTGHQVATEGWMPDNIVHNKLDLINFKYIHRKFGEKKLKTYPTIGFAGTYWNEKVLGIKYYYPLDYIEYYKEKVQKELMENYDWKEYGQKHFESIFTRFYQGYILPVKFNIDKRTFHYSASILSGQMTKQQARELISSNQYISSGQMEQDKEYVMKKLGFTKEEFEGILNMPPKKHTDYPSVINLIKKLQKFKNVLRSVG